MKRYNPKELEPKWQQTWEEQGIYNASQDSQKPKRYVLEYFPYPSGAAMHVGHVRNYTIGDAIARYNRMRGFNVLHPMGWDAFGLPAENYAIKTGISPRQAVDQNTAKFKKQLMQMGFSYDWTREIDSTDPNYYKWTQWFFLLLFKKGLAYQQESLQWWCPHDKTVLANEQVEAGKCWRCGNEVEKKALKQWFFKITEYADRLLADLDDLNWSDAIKAMQRNWIGRSVGAEVDFKVVDSKEVIKVFTTRPDTLYGATFMVLAPEHPLVQKILTMDQKAAVEKYIKQSQAKSDIERQETERTKTGVFTGSYAVNPVNKSKIPIWVADYVLMGYGTGAIMAVPAHDERDYAFANKYDLPVKQVISEFETYSGDRSPKPELETVVRRTVDAIITDGENNYLLQKENGQVRFVGGGIEDGETEEDALRREVLEEVGYKNIKSIRSAAPYVAGVQYHETKDINQQGYGAFYEVILANKEQVKSEIDEGKHSIEWVKKDDVKKRITWSWHEDAWDHYINQSTQQFLTKEGVLINSGKYDWLSTAEAREKIIADLTKHSQGTEKINYKIRDWLISRQRYWGAPIPIIHCPKDGAVAVPDKDLPVVLPDIKSYEPSGDGRSPLANVPEFVNTTCPECGGPAERETDTMDGFACSSWYFLRFADPHNKEAAFDKQKAEYWLPVDDYIGGAEHAVMHLLYARFWTKVMYDEGLISFTEPFRTLRNQGMILAPDGQKMSKSKGNTIEPDGLIEQGYGADATRIMELFIGPWNQMAAWSVEGMGGAFRFLQRVWTLTQETIEADGKDHSHPSKEEAVTQAQHRAVFKVSKDLEDLGFNTAIAAQMEYVNNLYKLKTDVSLKSNAWRSAIDALLQILAPFAPHISEELWHQLGHKTSVHTSEWPAFDEAYLVSDTMTIVVQVNGKVRATLELPTESSEAEVAKAAKVDENVAKYLDAKDIKKTIFVPGKLINFVVV